MHAETTLSELRTLYPAQTARIEKKIIDRGLQPEEFSWSMDYSVSVSKYRPDHLPLHPAHEVDHPRFLGGCSIEAKVKRRVFREMVPSSPMPEPVARREAEVQRIAREGTTSPFTVLADFTNHPLNCVNGRKRKPLLHLIGGFRRAALGAEYACPLFWTGMGVIYLEPGQSLRLEAWRIPRLVLWSRWSDATAGGFFTYRGRQFIRLTDEEAKAAVVAIFTESISTLWPTISESPKKTSPH